MRRILDKMIHALEIELYSDEMGLWNVYLSDGWKNKHQAKLAQERQEGFKLLGEYLAHLWW